MFSQLGKDRDTYRAANATQIVHRGWHTQTSRGGRRVKAETGKQTDTLTKCQAGRQKYKPNR